MLRFFGVAAAFSDDGNVTLELACSFVGDADESGERVQAGEAETFPDGGKNQGSDKMQKKQSTKWFRSRMAGVSDSDHNKRPEGIYDFGDDYGKLGGVKPSLDFPSSRTVTAGR